MKARVNGRGAWHALLRAVGPCDRDNSDARRLVFCLCLRHALIRGKAVRRTGPKPIGLGGAIQQGLTENA